MGLFGPDLLPQSYYDNYYRERAMSSLNYELRTRLHESEEELELLRRNAWKQLAIILHDQGGVLRIDKRSFATIPDGCLIEDHYDMMTGEYVLKLIYPDRKDQGNAKGHGEGNHGEGTERK